MYFNRKIAGTTGFDDSQIQDVMESNLDIVVHECFVAHEDLRAAIPTAMSACYEGYVCAPDDASRQQQVVCLEGMVGDVFEKIKSFFKKVWEKIKGWWNTIAKYFQALFTSQAEFVKKFKKELTEKSTTGFKYSAYKYDIGKLEGLKDTASKGTTDAKAAFVAALQATKGAGEATDKLEKITEMKKKVDSSFNGGKSGGVATFKKELVKSIRDGKSSKKEWKEFGSNSLHDMIAYIEDNSGRLADLKEAQEAVTDAAATYSEEVDKVKSEYEKDNKESTQKSHFITAVNKATEVAKYALSYQTATLSVANEMTKEISHEFERILKSFLHFKATKENYVPTNENATGSFLEQFTTHC